MIFAITKRTNIPDGASGFKVVDEPALDITVFGAIQLLKISFVRNLTKTCFVKAAIKKPISTDSKVVENPFL